MLLQDPRAASISAIPPLFPGGFGTVWGDGGAMGGTGAAASEEVPWSEASDGALELLLAAPLAAATASRTAASTRSADTFAETSIG